MKRLCFFLIFTVLLTAMVSAQNRNDRRRDIKPVTIEGALQLERGAVAVASGETIYYVPLLTRYIGFIEGLKEGAKVSVEGYTFRNLLHPVKVTIDGKSYDFSAGDRRPGFGRDRVPGWGRQDRHGQSWNRCGPGCNGCNPGSDRHQRSNRGWHRGWM
ncbi:MAG: hypothetical protein LBH44_13935 [Treponema sp.]|jgi:hypothetical protein|nr:hypothetical protein [Treponema sp.]